MPNPMVVERPRRGREMRTTEVAPEVSGGQALMYEGYVGEQKFLVPDEDLEVMKQLVDHNMASRPGPKDRYVRDYEFTHNPTSKKDGMFQDKLQRMTNKLKDIRSTSSSDYDDDFDKSSGSDSTLTDTKQRTQVKFADENKKKEPETPSETSKSPSETQPTTKAPESSGSSSSEESTDEEENTVDDESKRRQTGGHLLKKPPPKELISSSSTSSGNKSAELQPSPSQLLREGGRMPSTTDSAPRTASDISGARTPTGDGTLDRARFLISGHIRGDMKPIFIVHEFDGVSPLDNKKPDFTAKDIENDLMVLIAGMYSKESMLVEANHKPVRLRLQPQDIPIDSRSKVFEERFYEEFLVGDYQVVFEGSFVIQPKGNYTPLITVGTFRVPWAGESQQTPQQVYQKTDNTVYRAGCKIPIVFNNDNNQEYGVNGVGHRSAERRRSSVSKPASTLVTRISPKTTRRSQEQQRHSSKSSRHSQESPRHSHSSRQSSGSTATAEALAYEPHIAANTTKVRKRKSPKASSKNTGSQRDSESCAIEGGDVASEDACVYECNVERHRDKKGVFKRISSMLFPTK